MSTGMRQKLALAVVLAMETPLVILDEPTANLDPTARAEVLEVPAADGHMACLGRIPARWVRETVIARIPMFNAGARAAQLDTSGLQLDRLRQVRP
jgi:ABC-type polar amino acid transport system ATPase subunit